MRWGPNSLVELVRFRASVQPNDVAFVYLTDKARNEKRMTYGELDYRCRQVATWLVATLSAGVGVHRRFLRLFVCGSDGNTGVPAAT